MWSVFQTSLYREESYMAAFLPTVLWTKTTLNLLKRVSACFPFVFVHFSRVAQNFIVVGTWMCFFIMFYMSLVTTFCSDSDGMVQLAVPSPFLPCDFRCAHHEDQVSLKKPRLAPNTKDLWDGIWRWMRTKICVLSTVRVIPYSNVVKGVSKKMADISNKSIRV